MPETARSTPDYPRRTRKRPTLGRSDDVLLRCGEISGDGGLACLNWLPLNVIVLAVKTVHEIVQHGQVRLDDVTFNLGDYRDYGPSLDQLLGGELLSL